MMMTSKFVSAMLCNHAESLAGSPALFDVMARSVSDEAIQRSGGSLDCFAALAMTAGTSYAPLHHHHPGVFDQLLEGADQLRAERAVDGPVIAGQRHAHDAGDLDLAAANDRPLLAGADRQDRRMRWVDHGREV